MKRILYFLLIIASSLLISSCATLLNTTTQDIEVKSTPSGAKVTIDNKKFGLTPQVVNIERKKDHNIKIELDGYQAYETMVTTKISFWFWGNICNGFIPGMVVDYFTGSMNTLLPDVIDAQLVPAPVKQTETKK
jgi:hypothetical protein